MKKLFLTAALLVSVLAGCSKNDEGQSLYKETDYTNVNISVKLKPGIESPVYYGTKATGAAHGDGTYDDAINRLDVFIFDATSGELDGYSAFTSGQLTSLSGLSIKTKTGSKHIYAVANTSQAAWSGIVTESQFLAVEKLLRDDNYQSFVMSGYVTATITESCNVDITIQRLVGRVVLNSVKTAFAGTPYAGKQLENVKVYLTNVNGNVLIGNGNLPSNVTVLNSGGYVAADNASFATSGALYDAVGTVNDTGHSTPHYFYCYQNTLAEETSTKKFTRLVVEGTLDGTTYYYPININREDYGWSSAIDHKGILRNRSYTYNITILRPGSTNPDDVVDLATFTLDVTIDDWDIIPTSNVEF